MQCVMAHAVGLHSDTHLRIPSVHEVRYDHLFYFASCSNQESVTLPGPDPELRILPRCFSRTDPPGVATPPDL